MANRARSTYRMFRKIINESQEYELIRKSTPVVKLYFQGLSRPSPELENTLDYSKTDDQIVGCLHKFRKDYQGADARLLTHDGGPMMTANALGLPYVAVEDAWLLAPENNELEKENARLKERIAQLEQAEPQFIIDLVDSGGGTLERLELEYKVYDPLPEDTVEDLMKLLVERFPRVTEFGPSEPAPKGDNESVVDLTIDPVVYIPPDQDEIDRYSKDDYPAWLRECRESLTTFHKTLQSDVTPIDFTFAISNEGNQPGKSTLIDIKSRGDFDIYVEDYEAKTDELSTLQPRIPPPPVPPTGRWGTLRDKLKRSMAISNFMQGHYLRSNFPIHSIPSRDERRRDPNEFYYKPNRPTSPGKSIVLECEQWRHRIGAKHFSGRIFVNPAANENRGALFCQVHAENLVTPAGKTIPVRISIKRVSSEDRAKNLILKLKFDQDH